MEVKGLTQFPQCIPRLAPTPVFDLPHIIVPASELEIPVLAPDPVVGPVDIIPSYVTT